MPGRDFLFGFKFLTIGETVSPVLKKIETGIARVNAQVKAISGLSAANLGVAAAGFDAVGGAAVLALRSTVDAASEMQTKMAGVAAVTGLTSSAIAAVREHFESFSESHFAATAAQGVEVFGRLYQNLHNVAAAQKAADDAIKAAAATGANVTDIMVMMNAAHENFGATSTAVANSYAAAMHKYSLGPESMQAMTMGMAKLAPSLKMMGGNINDAMAIMGQAEQSMPGRGAQMIARLYEGLPEIAKKAHLDLGRGMFGVLDQIQARVRGLSAAGQIDVLAGMKMDRTMAPEFLRQLAVLDKMKAARDAIKGAGGAALMAEEAANAGTFANQSILLANAWENIKASLGSALLPGLTSIVSMMAKVATHVRTFVDNNQQIVKFGMIFVAVGAAVAIAAGAALALAAGFVALASFAPAMAALVLPISVIGTVVAATAAAVATWAPWIARPIWNLTRTLFSAGANIIKALASGIWSAITFPQRAIEAVVTKIRGYLPFSPAHEGPLRNLNRIRIVETIAESIRPGPALAAIRRTAAAIAIAAPIAVSPMMTAPALAGAARGAPGGGTIINIDYSPTFNIPPGMNAQEWLAAARQHARELKEIIDGRRAHEDRREF
jgi:hypothetical protein